MTTKELLSISRMVDTLPIFEGYDQDRLRTVGQTVFDLFTEEEGLEALFGLMRDALPDALRETAYALCCDVAAADGHAFQAELQLPARAPARARHRPAARRGDRARQRRPAPPAAGRLIATPGVTSAGSRGGRSEVGISLHRNG